MQSLRPWYWRWGVIAVAVPGLNACHSDAMRPDAAASQGISGRMHIAVSGSPDTWTSIVGEYVVKVDGPPSLVSLDSERTQVTRFERRKNSGGHWTTTWTLPGGSLGLLGADREPKGTIPKRRIIRAIVDEEQGTIDLFDLHGKRVQLPRFNALPPDHQARVSERYPKFANDIATPHGRALPTTQDWLNSMLVTPETKVAVDSMLATHYDYSGNVNGLLRYTRVQQDTVQELLIDPTTGVPIETNIAIGGSLRMQVRHTLQKIGDGLHLKTRTMTAQAIPGHSEPLIVDAAWTNLQFAGGQP